MPIYNQLKLAKELIRFPSITPVDAGTMNFLARKLKSLGFKCKILEFKSKNSKNLLKIYMQNWENLDPIFVMQATQMLCHLEI